MAYIAEILLVILAILIVFGLAKKILKAFGLGLISSLSIILATMVGELIPPYQKDGVYVQWGLMLLAVVCLLLWVLKGGIKEKLITVFGIAISTTALTLFMYFGEGKFEGNYGILIYMLIGIAMAFIFSKGPRSALIVSVVSVFISEAIMFIWKLNGYNKLSTRLDIALVIAIIAVLLTFIVSKITGNKLKKKNINSKYEIGKMLNESAE